MEKLIPAQRPAPALQQAAQQTIFAILFTISLSHLINDMLQSIIPSTYPILKSEFHLTFTQVGLITLVYQLTASILQPFVGWFTDKHPTPYSLAGGMGFTLTGLVLLAYADSFEHILRAVSLIGVGSSVFHPEASRVAHLASGGRKGLAQSIFQLGGNTGSALGPLLAGLIIVHHGQRSITWFSLAAVAGIGILLIVAQWYRKKLTEQAANKHKRTIEHFHNFSTKRVIAYLGILLILIFSKYFYMASMTSYYTFFLINKFHLTGDQPQMYLFAFMGAVATGTLLGGPLGDRFGRKYIIWFSILGVAPFTLLLPYASLFWTCVLSVCIGLILASAFSAILVYATELVPGKVGLIAGLFFGLAFGMGGLGSAVLGKLADKTSIDFVFRVCAFLPLIGIITACLPNLDRRAAR
ncbi:MFS transporter, FSR family, fosmidomycin resistance protein [Chitinophaga costaii]|uniref:MFS transporter, FSR family, fosmidomycin resistance protein n=1 Tax=Chitinophaga costaii TaxID=1335309 RepID=A0A1C4AYS6_9BACT|nr:MFS transporter [Chitinophaga costaii]PUZ26884.1 MFS transporter [Chitinophaga costaii]SCB99795.1 MFS transporter, FSR family, fosmidomycin resistance protein [Chitinophaga costaii]